MENSNRSNVEILKSVLKAGIPLAIALGGFIFARIVRKPSGGEIEEKIMVLRSRVEDIQNQENQLQTQFQFHLEKDEQMILELQNRVEFFNSEVSSSGEVFKRMEMMVIEVLGMLKRTRSENQKLYTRVNKLLRITDTQCRLLRKRSSQMEARELEILQSRDALKVKDAQIKKQMEARELEILQTRYAQEVKDAQIRKQMESGELEILQSRDAVEVKDSQIKKMEDEIKELKQNIEEMQIEKNRLLENLTVAGEQSTIQTSEEKEDGAVGNHESEIVVKAYVEEDENELVYLRKCNAFLRHELMRRNQEQEEQAEEDGHLDVDFGLTAADSGSDVDGYATSRSQVQVHVHSKRQKLMTKLRKWVEGTERAEQNLGVEENRCLRRHSVSHGIKVLLSARKSCSSA